MPFSKATLLRHAKRTGLAAAAAALGIAAAGGYYAVQAARSVGTLEAVISEIQRSGTVETGDLTEPIPPIVPHTDDIPYVEYGGLLSYFQRNVELLQAQYPSKPFTYSAWHLLSPFWSRKTVLDITSYYAPQFLICPQIYDPAHVRYARTETDVQGKKIPGLRVTTRLNPFYLKPSRPPMYGLLYTETLNARIYGFTHAMLVPALSKNVGPAPQFDYNGMHDWKDHKHYGKMDQVTKPIRLTNFAHAIGEQYVVSSHPDFSLELHNYTTEAVHFTFFLWGQDPVSNLITRAVPLAEAAPDFIFELHFEAPTMTVG